METNFHELTVCLVLLTCMFVSGGFSGENLNRKAVFDMTLLLTFRVPCVMSFMEQIYISLMVGVGERKERTTRRADRNIVDGIALAIFVLVLLTPRTSLEPRPYWVSSHKVEKVVRGFCFDSVKLHLRRIPVYQTGRRLPRITPWADFPMYEITRAKSPWYDFSFLQLTA